MRTGTKAVIGLAASMTLLASLTACTNSSTGPTDTSAPETSAPAEEEGTFAVDSDTIVFGAVPDQEAAENLNGPLADYIGIVTGKNIEYIPAQSYEALIESVVAGDVDVAFLSGFTYYISHDALGADITPFAAAITEEGAEPGYYSVAFANPNSGVTTLEEFAGHKVCFVSESSTSGRLFPMSMLLAAGVDPNTDITTVIAGGHDVSAEKTATGTECEVGFAEDAVADALIEAGDLVEVHREVVPGAPIVYQNALPQSVKDALNGIASSTAADMAAAGAQDADQPWFSDWIFALAPIDDAYYSTIRQLCELVQADSCNA